MERKKKKGKIRRTPNEPEQGKSWSYQTFIYMLFLRDSH